MRIGVVGSRRRNRKIDKEMVYDLVFELYHTYGDELIIVSGGCIKGADYFSKLASEEYGTKYIEYLPEKDPPVKNYREAVIRLYKRNRLIAKNSDHLYALVAKDRKGGTENTISWMLEFRKPITIIQPDGHRENIVQEKQLSLI